MQMQQGSWLILSVAFALGTIAVGPCGGLQMVKLMTSIGFVNLQKKCAKAAAGKLLFISFASPLQGIEFSLVDKCVFVAGFLDAHRG
jgi:hypothetical protein